MQFKKKISIHLVLLIVTLLTLVIAVIRFLTWGVRVNIEDFASEYNDEYSDNLDMILPVMDEKGHVIRSTGKAATIVCFGNAPFADDRGSADNLANKIASKTGATVYNCSVSGSYLAALEPALQLETVPMDIFNFYWLILTATKVENMDSNWETALEALGSSAPPEAREVYDTLSGLDFNSVDVVAVMYDASDYLAGHEMYNDHNTTDIRQFTGNLEAGIEILQKFFPRIRIIVMSPAYAFAVNEDGDYVSSDMYTYGWDVLSTYAIKEASSCAERSVTFIDHIYGTITEDNAQEYLTDNLHINAKGRELIADRFVHALQYFD